ncbi:MAG: ArgE/DapE family deacylase [Chloroflexota bacterium]|nr:ArgE/DapE family deacylase [Chloroflexota bacterium]
MSEVAELLRQLVAIDSINPDLVPGGAGEGQIARFVAGWLAAAGLAVEIDEPVPGRPNVIGIARGSGGGRSLLLNAHMDTVGVEGMERPHEPYIQGQRLYGRGAYDMKGGLAAIMLAGAAATRRSLRGDVIVTAVVDEEYASLGTSSIVKKWRADAAIVSEPTELEICTAHKGFTWFEVETEGSAAHGSLPHLGVDAIVKMGKVLTGLEALDLALRAHPAHPQLGSGSVHASLIAGGQELSSYPRRCLLSIERRTIPGESLQTVEAEIPSIFERIAASDATFKATVRTTMTRDPFEISPTEPIVQAVRRHAHTVLGREPGEGGATGWMDSALLAAAGIPTVIIGPGGAGAHAVIEWSDLTQVEQAVEILLAVAEEFCA